MKNDILNSLSDISERIEYEKNYIECGRVSNVTGLAIEVSGLSLPIGKVCRILLDQDHHVDAEVIGFSQQSMFVMAYENMIGIAKGKIVVEVQSSGMAPVGDALLGRVVDALGHPIDNKGRLVLNEMYPLFPKPFNPLDRARIKESLDVGVRAINSFLTTCKGQRMGIFAESGIGKSVLLGMMTKFTKADVVIVGLIGERGREVKEFIEEIIGEEGLGKTVIVAAAADNSPLMKVSGATYATSIAEYFRDKGKDVLLILDSLTRYAQAYREIALSCGEMPTSKGYTPTVFAKLSQLVERSGNGLENMGSISAFYTVLIEGEELSDPVAEHVRSLIDGHIILTRQLAEEGHYPAIDIEKSISRLMHSVVPKDQQNAALLIKKIISSYKRNKDMINIGMYQSGSDPITDCAIKHWNSIRSYLVQDMNEPSNMEMSTQLLFDLTDKVQT
jgi:flagellum-specific ATP synthase